MKNIKLILALSFIMTIARGQSQLMFQRTYDMNGCEGATCIQQIDEEYIIAGYENDHPFLMKTTIDGDTIWITKFIGYMGYAYSTVETLDKGYVVGGFTDNHTSGGRDIFMTKVDSNGTIIWSKTYGASSYEDGGYLQKTTDGGFIIIGTTNTFGAGQTDIYLIKTNSTGDIIWTKTFGGTADEYGYFGVQTNDGGFIITGSTETYGAGSSDVLVIKTDSSGNPLWEKTYGSTNWDVGYSIQQTKTNQYIITGTANFGEQSVYLIKIDSVGNLLWSKTLGDGMGNVVKITPHEEYVITGTDSFSAYLAKTDSIGNLIFAQEYGSGTTYGYALDIASNGKGYILGGYTNTSSQVIYLIKTDSIGHTECNENASAITVVSPATQVSSPTVLISQGGFQISPTINFERGGVSENHICSTTDIIKENHIETNVVVYPNPANSIVQILGKKSEDEIKIFDVLGNQVFQGKQNTIDITNLSNGIYFINVSNSTNKFVKE